MQPTESEIRLKSYFIWQSEGCPHGRAWDHWLRAEYELKEQETAATPKKPARPKTASKRKAPAKAIAKPGKPDRH